MLEEMAIMEMLFADLSTGYDSNEEEWGSVVNDEDILADIMYEPEYFGISFDDFDDFDVFDEFV